MHKQSVIIPFLYLAITSIGCSPSSKKYDSSEENATGKTPLSQESDLSDEFAIAKLTIHGVWEKLDCTKAETGGTQELWYQETITIGEQTWDSVNRYYKDKDCSELDTYQPSETSEEHNLKYSLGKKLEGHSNRYELDILPLESLNLPGFYTIVEFDAQTLRLGGGNASTQGDSVENRVNDISDRQFTRKSCKLALSAQMSDSNVSCEATSSEHGIPNSVNQNQQETEAENPNAINSWDFENVSKVNIVYFSSMDGEPLGRYILENKPEKKWSENEKFSFQETSRDQWSIYLYDESRKVRLQLDLHTRTIYYTDESSERRAQYNITDASEG